MKVWVHSDTVFILHGRWSFMQSAFRFHLNTSLVPSWLRPLARSVLCCSLGLGALASAQTGWRPASLPSSNSYSGAPATPPSAAPYSAPYAAPYAAPSASADAVRLGEGALQMFGVRLSTATREEMRQAILREGLTVQREDEAFTEDIYDAPNLMPGLLQLKFTYARDGQKLAKVEYVFTTFLDNAHAGELMQRIESRFGRPLRVTGREESGPYHAVWRLPDLMEIFVGREWPQKTTYLKFFNVPVLGPSAAESEREGLQPRQGKAQNNNALPIWVPR